MIKIEISSFCWAILILSSTISGCISSQSEAKSANKKVEFEPIEFCPNGVEPLARRVLGIQNNNVIDFSDVVVFLKSQKTVYEKKRYWTSQCFSKLDCAEDEKYIIYGEFSEDKARKEDFIVSVRSDGSIRFVEEAFSYRAPRY